MATKRTTTTLLLALLCGLLSIPAMAQLPRQISYQGVLTTSAGTPLPDGNHTILIKLYDGGSNVYSETHNVSTVRGVFNVVIGSVTPIPASLSFENQYMLGITVDGGTEFSPRTPLTAAPYALNSAMAMQAKGLAPGATGVVTSVNGASGDITFQGGGGTTVNRSGNTITISSSGGGGGGGIAGIQSSDGSLAITDPNGPTANVIITPGGVTTTKIANGAVTLNKLSTTGAANGQVLTFDGGALSWSAPASGLTLPYSGTHSGGNAFSVTNSGTGNALFGANTAATGSNNTIVGEANSTTHGAGATAGVTGVLGRVVPTTPGGYSAGLRGINNGTGGTGIGTVGYQAGSGWGVYGETPSGFGVYGLTTNNSASSVGVRGETFSTNGIAVEAKYSGTGVGVALELDNGAIKVAGVNKAAFVHTATPANKLSANGTDIDNPLCNGDANAILFVTQKLNPSGIVYNNSAIGVYYNTIRNKWEIFNQNNVAIPNNAQFNVLVIKQ